MFGCFRSYRAWVVASAIFGWFTAAVFVTNYNRPVRS